MRYFISLLLVFTMFAWAADKIDYVGSHKCRMCHKKKSKGEQFQKWEAGPHAQAFETLKNEQSIEIAKKMELKNDPWEAPECLRCHVTGWEDGGYEVKPPAFWKENDKGRLSRDAKRMAGLQGVGCESCHGKGSEYKSKKVKLKVLAGEISAESVGLEYPDEKTCITCHNTDSPTAPEGYVFKYKERWSKIDHGYPLDVKF